MIRWLMVSLLAVSLLAVLPQRRSEAGPLRWMAGKARLAVRFAGRRAVRRPIVRRLAPRRNSVTVGSPHISDELAESIVEVSSQPAVTHETARMIAMSEPLPPVW